MVANIKGVFSLTRVAPFTSSPFCNSCLTLSTSPMLQLCQSVSKAFLCQGRFTRSLASLPQWLLLLRSRSQSASWRSKSRMRALWSWEAAWCRAVWPWASRWQRLAPSCRSLSAEAKLPFRAARSRGVRSLWLLASSWLCLISFWARSSEITSGWSLRAARWTGKYFLLVDRQRSAQPARRDSTRVTCPAAEAWWRAVQPLGSYWLRESASGSIQVLKRASMSCWVECLRTPVITDYKRLSCCSTLDGANRLCLTLESLAQKEASCQWVLVSKEGSAPQDLFRNQTSLYSPWKAARWMAEQPWPSCWLTNSFLICFTQHQKLLRIILSRQGINRSITLFNTFCCCLVSGRAGGSTSMARSSFQRESSWEVPCNSRVYSSRYQTVCRARVALLIAPQWIGLRLQRSSWPSAPMNFCTRLCKYLMNSYSRAAQKAGKAGWRSSLEGASWLLLSPQDWASRRRAWWRCTLLCCLQKSRRRRREGSRPYWRATWNTFQPYLSCRNGSAPLASRQTSRFWQSQQRAQKRGVRWQRESLELTRAPSSSHRACLWRGCTTWFKVLILPYFTKKNRWGTGKGMSYSDSQDSPKDSSPSAKNTRPVRRRSS